MLSYDIENKDFFLTGKYTRLETCATKHCEGHFALENGYKY